MATKYKRAGTTDWSTDASWSTTDGGAADTVAPTSADDVKFTASSGSCDILATFSNACRSIDCTGFTGTITQYAKELHIGDGTAGAGNIAMKLVSGMTYTVTAATNPIFFESTSATVQTIDAAGKTLGNVTFNATSGGSWKLTGAMNTGTTGVVTLTKGTLDINGQTCSWGLFSSSNTNTRSLILGAANITLTGVGAAWNLDNTGTTLDMGTATVTFTGLNPSPALAPSGKTWAIGSTIVFQNGGQLNSTGYTLGNLTFTGAATKTCTYVMAGSFTVAGTLTSNGNSSINRQLFSSSVVGTARTITAATVVCSNTDFQDITGAGAGSWDFSARTDIGDCGGCSNITFPASVTCTWVNADGGNWDAVANWNNTGDDRVPLPQDDVSFACAFNASKTVVATMPRLARSISWVGATGSPTWNFGSVANAVYGSIDLTGVGTISGTQVLTLAGRSNYTITSAGKTFTQNITFAAPGGTYTLSDGLSCGFIVLSNGTLSNSGNYNVTATGFTNSATSTRAVNMGSGTWTLNGGGVTPLTFVSTGLTKTGSSETIVISLASASTRTFAGGGLTYGTLTYTVAGSTGELDITGSNSFAAINFSDATNARSLKFTKATQTTIRNGNGFNVRGTTGKLMTIDTIDGAGVFTLTSPNVQSTDYMNVIRSTVDASPKWYAGANSTDGTGNTNWLFAAGYALSSGTFSGTMDTIEYSAYANVNGVASGLTLAEQKLKYFAYKIGYQPASVRDGEISFLRLVTGSNGTDVRAMWNKYATMNGLASLNTEEEIKKNVFLNLGLPF